MASALAVSIEPSGFGSVQRSEELDLALNPAVAYGRLHTQMPAAVRREEALINARREARIAEKAQQDWEKMIAPFKRAQARIKQVLDWVDSF